MAGLVGLDPMPSVPSMAVDAQDFVEDLISEARQHAQEAVTTANEAIMALKDAHVPEVMPEPPAAPSINAQVTASITGGFNTVPNFGVIGVELPPEFTPDDIQVPDISADIPEYVPIITGISLPAAPIMTLPDMPVEPGIETDFYLPDAPAKDYGGVPDLAPVVLPDYTPVTLEAFDDAAPVFNVATPSEQFSWTEPTYQQHVATRIQTALEAMLEGGTGLTAVVETAIWERDRERVVKDARRQRWQARNTVANDGWGMPPGALDGTIIAVNRDAGDKIAAQSRDVAIKQADLEQQNRQFAIQRGIEFEGLWIQLFLAAAQRSFDVVKLTMDMRIQIFNAQVTAFNVEQQVFASKIERFKAKLQFALAQIDLYKARLEAASVTAEVNKSLIAAFQAKIQAYEAQVQAYDSLVKAASARADLQKNKVDIYRAQIEGRGAQVNAKKTEFDAYAARVQAEASKADLERANAQAYSARVGAISAVAEISLKEADVKIAVSRQKLDFQVANMQRLANLAQVQLGQIQARVAGFQAETQRGSAQFAAAATAKQVELQTVIETGRTLIMKYQADIQAWTARVQQIIETARVNSASLTAMGQIASNVAAGAQAGTSVAAGFQAQVSRGENTNKSEQKSESESHSVSESTAQNTNININNDGFE